MPAPAVSPSGDDRPDNWLDLPALIEVERRMATLTATALSGAAGAARAAGGADTDLNAGSFVSPAAVLWFDALRADDRVTVTAAAVPALRAAAHLLERPDGELADVGSAGSTVWSAVARRRLPGGSPPGRLVALLDATDLDDPAAREAATDARTAALGELLWVVVCRPGAPERFPRLFAAAGWQVLEARHGRRREAAFQRGGGSALRSRLERLSPADLRRLVGGGEAEPLRTLAADVGGQDLPTLVDLYDEADPARPTVVFAHTLDGAGPASAEGSRPGPPSPGRRDGRPGPGTPAAALVARIARRLERVPAINKPLPVLPEPPLLPDPATVTTTAAAVSAALNDLADPAGRAPRVAERLVTVRVGDDGGPATVAALLGELGATGRRYGEPLLVVGLVDGPGSPLPALAGWRPDQPSVLVVRVPWAGGEPGQPAGSDRTDGLDRVGGAVCWRPAFPADAHWCLTEALERVGRPGGGSSYLLVSDRPVDPSLAAPPPGAEAALRRRQVLAGAYRPRDGSGLTLAGCGAVMPEVLRAADELAAGLGRPVPVICVTSPDLLLRALAARRGLSVGDPWILDAVLPAGRRGPLVTVCDGDPATLGFLAGVHGDPLTALGVSPVPTIVGAALDLLDV